MKECDGFVVLCPGVGKKLSNGNFRFMADLNDMRTYQLNLSLVEPVAESCGGFRSEGACLLTTCIDVTLAGDEFIKGLTRKINRLLDEQLFVRKHHQEFITLTPREKEVLCLLGRGLNNPQIATQLCISRKTVEQHRKNINQKLQITTFFDLVKYIQAFDLT